MIAPRTLQFFDSAWHPFGTKHGLAAVIESRTGVPKEILDGFQQLKGHGNSGYVDAASIGVGIHYEISITPRVVREEGADADSWDVMKVQIHGPRIANSKL